jgi:hypothetical protein
MSGKATWKLQHTMASLSHPNSNRPRTDSSQESPTVAELHARLEEEMRKTGPTSRDVLMQAPQRLLSGCSTMVSLKGLVRAVVRRAEREVQVSSSVRGARAGSTVGRSVRRWTGLGISLIACRCEVAWVGFEVGDGGLVALRCVQASLARAFVLSRGFCQ